MIDYSIDRDAEKAALILDEVIKLSKKCTCGPMGTCKSFNFFCELQLWLRRLWNIEGLSERGEQVLLGIILQLRLGLTIVSVEILEIVRAEMKLFYTYKGDITGKWTQERQDIINKISRAAKDRQESILCHGGMSKN